MRTQIVFVLALLALSFFPEISLGKQNILEDIFRDVVGGMVNPKGQGSVLSESSYEQELRSDGVTLKYRAFAVSREGGGSQNPDDYNNLREVDLSNVLYVGRETSKVFFQIDLINPRNKDLEIRRFYASQREGNNSQARRDSEDSSAGNMERTRLYVSITPNEGKLNYHNEIIIIIFVDGREAFKIGNFICIKNSR